MSFGTIILDVIWDENYVNKLLIGPKQVFFLSVKNHDNFSSQNIVISSQNNVRNYCTEGHEQVSSLQHCVNGSSFNSPNPSAIDSESIKPLSVLHSGSKREW